MWCQVGWPVGVGWASCRGLPTLTVPNWQDCTGCCLLCSQKSRLWLTTHYRANSSLLPRAALLLNHSPKPPGVYSEPASFTSSLRGRPKRDSRWVRQLELAEVMLRGLNCQLQGPSLLLEALTECPSSSAGAVIQNWVWAIQTEMQEVQLPGHFLPQILDQLAVNTRKWKC